MSRATAMKMATNVLPEATNLHAGTFYTLNYGSHCTNWLEM
jgi:hypothetical protein